MQKIQRILIKHLWWIIAVTGFALLVCHSLQITSIVVDSTSLVLVGIILLSPFAAAIKRIKIGDFEAEIDSQEVKRVTDDVASKLPELKAASTETDYDHPAVTAILELAKTDKVVALAKLRIELESTLRRLQIRSGGVQKTSCAIPLNLIMRDLIARDIVPRDLASSIPDVLTLCNRAIHGAAIRDIDADAVIQVGGELLQGFERVVRDFGVGHPIEKTAIPQAEVETHYAAKYRVVTIIPLVESPQRVTYVLTHDELEDFFDGYSEFAEFVISIERIEPTAAT
jgi:hypothetical protein